MKQAFSLLLILGLLASAALAHAQTVREQVGAPEQVELDFTSPQRVRVSILADVELPDVYAFPVQEVKRRIVTERELAAMADAALGQGSYAAIDDASQPLDPQPIPLTAYRDVSSTFHFAKEPRVVMLSRVGSAAASISAAYNMQNGRLRNVQAQYMTSPWDDERYVAGLLPPMEALPDAIGALTLDEARQQALDIAASINGELALACTEAYPTIRYTDMESMDYQYKTVGAVYLFRFTHKIGQTHVTYEDGSTGGALDSQDDTYTVPFQYERFWVALNESGIKGMEYVSPYEMGEVLEQNVTILPFESILTVAKAMLPLKYATYVPSGVLELDVSRIVLGYTRVAMKDAPERYMLVPVWDFMGKVNFPDGYAQGGAYNSLLCINAMDGTVIDRDFGY